MTVAKPYILDISPYIGGDITPKGMIRRIVLASNESPLGPSPHVLDFFQNFSINLASYPSGNARILREAIGAIHGLDPERILCGNGSEDIIHLIARVFAGAGDEVIVPEFGFLAYPIAVKSSGAKCVIAKQPHLKSEVESILNAISDRTKIIFLDNPGNPLGCMMTKEDVLKLHQNIPSHVILVLDEAYAEFVDDIHYESGLTLLKDAPNVIVLRTFSKAYGLAGVRIGWAHAHDDVLQAINRIRQPFNVNSIAQTVGAIAVQDQKWVKMAKNHNHAWLFWTKEQLEHAGFDINPSYGNFLLINCESKEKAQSIYRFLGENGILLRPLTGYGLHEYLRISIGKDSEMEELIHTLKTYPHSMEV